MKVSAIAKISENCCPPRRNNFIQYSNSFMSVPEGPNPIEKANKKHEKMGLENLEEFTIFPKEVVDGRMILKA